MRPFSWIRSARWRSARSALVWYLRAMISRSPKPPSAPKMPVMRLLQSMVFLSGVVLVPQPGAPPLSEAPSDVLEAPAVPRDCDGDRHPAGPPRHVRIYRYQQPD